ncbi:protein Shroom1 [Trichomycterus rosablanca]|uniref:protein Shroom1 n=1 Tax=Trichomycterus rosablanca TaxID=2290929 RepID=UPI002F35E9DF
MDCFNLHFEKMSNLDLHPLSLSVSRLSPAKSTSSIDQYTHHHGKGDSAYSSFSGGSTVPDYSSSPFLAEDVHPHSLHYADLKYVRGVYGPSITESDLKSMPQHYQSMEAISHHHHQSHNKYFHVKHSSVPAPLYPPPPPPPPLPPVRLDSFVTTRNLETARISQNTEQHADSSFSSLQNPNLKDLGSRHDFVSGHRVTQDYQRNQDLPDSLECSPQDKNVRLEIRHAKSHSAYGIPVSEQHHAVNAWQMPQNMTNGSIQHKGQFYFVTGVCESTEPQPQCHADSTEPYRQAGKQRSLNTIESCLENLHLRKQSNPDCKVFQESNISNTLGEDGEPLNSHVLNHFANPERLSQSIDDMENTQQITNTDISRHHSTNHPIFYCGPEETFSTSAHCLNRTEDDFMTNMDQNIYSKKDEHVNKSTRQPVAAVPTEKISKENTPLLYHLTGASRVSIMNSIKSDNDFNSTCKEQDQSNEKQNSEKGFIYSTDDSVVHSEAPEKQKLTEFYYHCSTLDNSFQKYYKEKLKDVQSMVLRETSFKRKDLQQSWPLRIEQPSDKWPSVIPPSHHGHDLLSSPENPTEPHLPTSQQTDKKPPRNQSAELERATESETIKQQNIAQPQVPRIGSRRRLTIEKKKLSRSEPEKLNQLADGSAYIMSRSLGNEGEEQLLKYNHDEQGVVAIRRKLLETRGRAMSASFFSRSTLKQLQQKALLAYKERKAGSKVAEPQQPTPQVPSQLAFAGRRSDPTPHSGFKAKLLRPLSASRIQIPSSSKHSLLNTDQHSGQSGQGSSKEGRSASSEKSVSVEDLLDEYGQFNNNRGYSTSSPLQFHLIQKQLEPSSEVEQGTSRDIFEVEEATPAYTQYASSVPDQPRVRKVAPRGKSMEELGVSEISRAKVLSKSSEQLHQLHKKHIMSERERKDLSFSVNKEEHSKRRLQQHIAPLIGFEQNAHAGHVLSVSKDPCSLDHPSTVLSSQVVPCDTTTASSGSEFSAVLSHMTSSGGKILATHHSSNNGTKDTATPSAYKGTSENIPVSKTRVQEHSFMSFEASPGDVIEIQRYNSQSNANEVSLTPGITTDPSLWLVPPQTDDRKVTPALQPPASSHPLNTNPSLCSEVETAHNLSELDPELPSTSREEKKDAKKAKESTSKEQSPWEILVHEVVSADQSLAQILYPIHDRKTAVMLIEQLLSEDTLLMEEHYRKKQEQTAFTPQHSTCSPEMTAVSNISSSPLNDGLSNMGADLTQKKRQLIAHIKDQLKPLERLRSSLQGEEKENRVLGESLVALVHECFSPAELERYTQFIEDLERVTSLLLCLSARLARVQNALSTVDENTDLEEKQSLENRHHLLCRQREDAKDLKNNLDRRERMISTILAKQLSESQLQEYRRFIQTKASLLIRQKDLDEKQRLGEEQIEAILNSLPP